MRVEAGRFLHPAGLSPEVFVQTLSRDEVAIINELDEQHDAVSPLTGDSSTYEVLDAG